MAPVPKRKLSRQRQGKRRAAIHLNVPNLVRCPNCKEPVLAHTVCKNCGQYHGKQVLAIPVK